MLRGVLRRLAYRCGWEIRRRSRQDLPFLHDCSCDGHRFPFWIANEHAASWWAKNEIRFDAEMGFLKESCLPGMVVVEAGSHHGMHTVQMGRWVGATGEVHAFELNAENAMVLAANAGVNRMPHVRVVHAAVSDASGWLETSGERVASGQRRARAISLDDYCAQNGIERVGLLKIDVEGFEAKVLAGARRLLDSRPRMDLELHLDDLARYGSDAAGVLELIGTEGYEIEMMVRPDWQAKQPWRGLAGLPAAGIVNLFFRPAANERPGAAPGLGPSSE